MESILQYMPLISAIIFAGILSVSLMQFSIVRKNMKVQTEGQVYTRMIETRLKLENSDSFTFMARESPQFVERFDLVEKPEEYYTIIAFLDLFEFLFRFQQGKLIELDLWMRWKEHIKLLMTIPKFRKIWDKTKQVHTKEFVQFIDSCSM
jgi:hypothetical protein